MHDFHVGAGAIVAFTDRADLDQALTIRVAIGEALTLVLTETTADDLVDALCDALAAVEDRPTVYWPRPS